MIGGISDLKSGKTIPGRLGLLALPPTEKAVGVTSGLAEKSGGFIPARIAPKSLGLGFATPEGLNTVEAVLASSSFAAAPKMVRLFLSIISVVVRVFSFLCQQLCKGGLPPTRFTDSVASVARYS